MWPNKKAVVRGKAYYVLSNQKRHKRRLIHAASYC